MASSSAAVSNTKSMFSMFSGVLPTYFSSEWSFAQMRVTDRRLICAIRENMLMAVSLDGQKFYTAEIDLKQGGECKN